VQLSAHASLQRLINHLMLLHALLAAEGRRYDARRIVVAIAGEIANLDLRIGKSRLDQRLNRFGVHRHTVNSGRS
jgi:hypothetical protein